MDMNYITEEVLTKLDACEDGKAWWLRNELSGFPVDRLKEIKGDYNDYIVWLKDKFYNCTYNSYGNRLTYKDPDGYEWTKTYDSYGNCLTRKDSDGYEETRTYDSNGNCLTYKDSYGNGWSRTYDSNGNRLTYKDSDGLIWSKTYDDNDNELNHKQSNGYEETRTYDDKGNLTSDDDNIYKYNRENGLILFKNGKEILSIPKFKV